MFDCLEFLKPYHTFLLLHEPEDLLSQLPLDGSPPLYKLVRAANPTMSFRALASETMIPLVHIFELAGHLLYWGKRLQRLCQKINSMHKIFDTQFSILNWKYIFCLIAQNFNDVMHQITLVFTGFFSQARPR